MIRIIPHLFEYRLFHDLPQMSSLNLSRVEWEGVLVQGISATLRRPSSVVVFLTSNSSPLLVE